MALGRWMVLLCLAAAPASAAGQSIFAPNGLEVELTARMEPDGTIVSSSVWVAVSGRVTRFVLDQAQRRYFVYDLLIQSKEDSGALLVRLEPSRLSPAEINEARSFVDPAWSPVPLVKYPLIPEVRPGDTVAIDLLVNARTHQKVVDYLVVKRPAASGSPAGEPPPPRDLSVEDVQLHLTDFRIGVNGAELDESTRVGGGIAGPALWLYLPSRGRFVMSLVPNAKLGFRRAGEVADGLLTFAAGQDRFVIRSADRIAPAGGRFNLYVRHDPGWRPKNDAARAPFLVGSADRPESLIAK